MLKNYLVLCLSLVISLFLCEIILGMHFEHENNPDNNTWYSFQFVSSKGEPLSSIQGDLKLSLHPAYVYDNLPNQNHSFFAIDELGNRINVLDDAGRARKEKNIIISGGSTAFGTGLPSGEDTLTSHMEKLLPSFNVINQGVIGHKAGQEMIKTLIKGIEKSPILTISLSGWNDFYGISTVSKGEKYYSFGGISQIETQLLKARVLDEKSFVSRLWGINTQYLFLNLKKLISSFFPENLSHQTFISTEAAAEGYASHIIKYKHIVNSYNSDFLLVLQPDYNSIKQTRDHTSLQGKQYDEFRALAKEKLKAHNIMIIDLNDYKNRFTKDLFMDSIHLNSDGNKLMAELILENIPLSTQRKIIDNKI